MAGRPASSQSSFTSANATVFVSSVAIVIGPTPPGTGVIAPATWRASDLGDASAWRHDLTAEEVAELEAALAVARGTGKAMRELGREDFPLPKLSGAVARWLDLLERGRGFLNVRGVPVDWVNFDRDYTRRHVRVPTYPFQRQRFRFETTDPTSEKRTESEAEALLNQAGHRHEPTYDTVRKHDALANDNDGVLVRL